MPYVETWIDAADVLDGLSDEEFRAEYRKRFSGDPSEVDSMMLEAIDRIERGDVDYGLYLLRQIVQPKFARLEDCIRKLGNAKRR